MIEHRLIARDDELDSRLMLLETREGVFRERLTANRTYYVSTSGSNNNDGRSASTPWATIQFAVDWIASRLDLGPYQVTIQLANGTYTETVVLRSVVAADWLSAPSVIIRGNPSSPSSCTIQTTAANSITIASQSISSIYEIEGVRIIASGSGGIGLSVGYNAVVILDRVDFGACTNIHVYAVLQGLVSFAGNYNITGSATYHYLADSAGQIACYSKTITLSGALTFTQFAYATSGIIRANSSTYSGGTVTGQRYLAANLGIIYGDGNANKFPGSIAGSPTPGTLSSSGGYYV